MALDRGWRDTLQTYRKALLSLLSQVTPHHALPVTLLKLNLCKVGMHDMVVDTEYFPGNEALQEGLFPLFGRSPFSQCMSIVAENPRPDNQTRHECATSLSESAVSQK